MITIGPSKGRPAGYLRAIHARSRVSTWLRLIRLLLGRRWRIVRWRRLIIARLTIERLLYRGCSRWRVWLRLLTRWWLIHCRWWRHTTVRRPLLTGYIVVRNAIAIHSIQVRLCTGWLVVLWLLLPVVPICHCVVYNFAAWVKSDPDTVRAGAIGDGAASVDAGR